MMKTGKCPKCGSENLALVESVAANEETGSFQMQPTFLLAVNGKGSFGRTGELQAYACNDCLYVEFYLKEKIKVDGKHVKTLR